MIGYKVADIPAIMGSFDPCIGKPTGDLQWQELAIG